MNLFADSVLCTATSDKGGHRQSTVDTRNDLMVFICPPGTTASTIRVAPGHERYVLFYEIEVFTTTGLFLKVFISK